MKCLGEDAQRPGKEENKKRGSRGRKNKRKGRGRGGKQGKRGGRKGSGRSGKKGKRGRRKGEKKGTAANKKAMHMLNEICGSDNKTNVRCDFELAKCIAEQQGQLLKVAYQGKCMSSCDRSCPSISRRKICGFDGKKLTLYQNHCEFKKAQCLAKTQGNVLKRKRKGIVVVHYVFCVLLDKVKPK